MSIEDLVSTFRSARIEGNRMSGSYTEQDKANFTKVYDAVKPQFPIWINSAKKRFGGLNFHEDELMEMIDKALMNVIDRYEERGAKFAGCVFSAFYNAIVSRIRMEKVRGRYKVERFSQMVHSPSYEVDPATSLETKDYANYFLDNLSLEQRRIVSLRMRGLEFTEIAELIGKPRNNAGRTYEKYQKAIEAMRLIPR